MTKTLIIFSLILTSQLSFAKECTKAQLDEAMSSHGTLTVQNNFMVSGVAIKVTDLCVDGNSIRPKGTAFVTVGMGDVDDPERTVNWSIPLTGESEECVDTGKEESCEWQKVTRTIPLSGKLSIIDLGHETADEVCTKSYQIPRCQ